MKIARKIRTFLFIFRKRPAQAWELLQIRLERKIGGTLLFLSIRRLATYLFEVLSTNKISKEFDQYGNYYLLPSLIPERPVVFSFGVGQDIEFDISLLKRHHVDLFLFDPTPASKRFVDGLGLPSNARFSPVAVADYDGRVDLFTDDLEHDFEKTSSVSMFNHGFYNNRFSVECKKIKTIMAEYDVSHLDVLKMDIEGAAIRVLRDALRDGIFPTQVACEFERPEKLVDVYSFLQELAALFVELKNAGYEVFRTRDSDKGCQVEIVAVRSRVPAIAAQVTSKYANTLHTDTNTKLSVQ